MENWRDYVNEMTDGVGMKYKVVTVKLVEDLLKEKDKETISLIRASNEASAIIWKEKLKEAIDETMMAVGDRAVNLIYLGGIRKKLYKRFGISNTQEKDEVNHTHQLDIHKKEDDCVKCGHSKEWHYWNGAGEERMGGYDACLKEGCKCECYKEKVI